MPINDARSLEQLLGEVTPYRRALSLASLYNVAKTPPADDDLLVYDEATGLWTARSLVLADLPAIGLDDLSDVVITTPATNAVLQYDGANWIDATVSLVPTGAVTSFAGSSAPTGWMLCDGSSQLRAGALAALFAVIGTTYGSADGTHFNLPDLRGRVPVGLDNMGGSDANRLDVANTLGGSGGEQFHGLTQAEMPEHTHNMAGSSTDNTNTTRGGSPMMNNSSTDTTHAPGAGNITTTTGNNNTHNNMQPYLLLNHIIKT